MWERAVDLARVVRLSGVTAVFSALAAIPTAVVEAAPRLCLVNHVFGVECLGCGMTRALSALLHGDVPGAVARNRLVLVAFAALVTLLVADTLALALGRKGSWWLRAR